MQEYYDVAFDFGIVDLVKIPDDLPEGCLAFSGLALGSFVSIRVYTDSALVHRISEDPGHAAGRRFRAFRALKSTASRWTTGMKAEEQVLKLDRNKPSRVYFPIFLQKNNSHAPGFYAGISARGDLPEPSAPARPPARPTARHLNAEQGESS